MVYKSILSINKNRIYNYVKNGWPEVAILNKKKMAENYKVYEYRERPLTQVDLKGYLKGYMKMYSFKKFQNIYIYQRNLNSVTK